MEQLQKGIGFSRNQNYNRMNGPLSNSSHNGNVNPKFEDPGLYWQRNSKIETNDWLYTLNDLNSSPSVKASYGLKQELDRYRLSQDRIIQACKMLNLAKAAIFCSMIYLQRFYQRYSMNEFSTTSVSAACLYIACKKLEMHRNIKQVSAAYARLITGRFNRTDELPEEVLWRTRDELENNEDFVLASLCFDLKLTNPYQYIEDILSPKDYDYKPLKSFTIAKIESLTTSQIFLIFKIEDVINTFLVLSAILKKIEFPIDHFEKINLKIDPEEVLKIQETTKLLYESRELSSKPLDEVLDLKIEKEDIVKLAKGTLTSPPESLRQTTIEKESEFQEHEQITNDQPTPKDDQVEKSQKALLSTTTPQSISKVHPQEPDQDQIQSQEASAQIPSQIQIEKKADLIESPTITRKRLSIPHEETQNSQENEEKNGDAKKVDEKPTALLEDPLRIEKPSIASKSIEAKDSKIENESKKPGTIGTKSKIFASRSPFSKPIAQINTLKVLPTSPVFSKRPSLSPKKDLVSPKRESVKQDKFEVSKQKESETTKIDDNKKNPPRKVSAPISRPISSSSAIEDSPASQRKPLKRKKSNGDDEDSNTKPISEKKTSVSKRPSIAIPQPNAREPNTALATKTGKKRAVYGSSLRTNANASNKEQATKERKSNAGRKSRRERLERILGMISSDYSDLSD